MHVPNNSNWRSAEKAALFCICKAILLKRCTAHSSKKVCNNNPYCWSNSLFLPQRARFILFFSQSSEIYIVFDYELHRNLFSLSHVPCLWHVDRKNGESYMGLRPSYTECRFHFEPLMCTHVCILSKIVLMEKRIIQFEPLVKQLNMFITLAMVRQLFKNQQEHRKSAF